MVEARLIHDPPVLHRGQGRVGRAPALRQLKEALGVEAPHHHRGSARAERHQKADRAAGGVERRRDHHHRTVAKPAPQPKLGPAHRMRLHHALGRAGGAGGVDDVAGVLGPERKSRRPRPVRREPVLQRPDAFDGAQRDAGRQRHPLACRQRPGADGIQHQQLCAAVADHRQQA